jgi:hypothetical protein
MPLSIYLFCILLLGMIIFQEEARADSDKRHVRIESEIKSIDFMTNYNARLSEICDSINELLIRECSTKYSFLVWSKIENPEQSPYKLKISIDGVKTNGNTEKQYLNLSCQYGDGTGDTSRIAFLHLYPADFNFSQEKYTDVINTIKALLSDELRPKQGSTSRALFDSLITRIRLTDSVEVREEHSVYPSGVFKRIFVPISRQVMHLARQSQFSMRFIDKVDEQSVLVMVDLNVAEHRCEEILCDVLLFHHPQALEPFDASKANPPICPEPLMETLVNRLENSLALYMKQYIPFVRVGEAGGLVTSYLSCGGS